MEQRRMIHLECGTDNWAPTSEELHQLIEMFQKTSFDSVGAIVATIEGVKATELMVDDETIFYAGTTSSTSAILQAAIEASHLKNIEVPTHRDSDYQLGFQDGVNRVRNILKRAVNAYFVDNVKAEDEDELEES